ncbi:Conserved_hypothetical protein [Hexamita inflata]|uniref:Uncharacterized protein n=1 Tax=Hexamita inflata TaxID=28002 RepID=A0AA86PQX5_9EUKA|nr:Conserved hypothetical protein [Hexamita inflata]
MSDLDVFCDAFQAVIDFLALNKQNDNICKTLDSLKAYFMYKISKKSSVDLALQDAVRELDNKCAILEQQNTVLLQKQNEDNEKIERLEYFNNTLTEQLTRNKIFLSQQEEKNNYYVQQINKLRKQLELQQQMNTSDKVVIEDFKIRYKRVQESQNKQKKQIENAHNKYLDTEARLHQEEQANSRYRNINKELEYQIESSTKQIADMQNELIALKEAHNAEMEKIVLYEREAQKNSIQDLPGNEIIGIAAQTILKLSLSSANELVDLGVSGSDLQSLLQVIKCIDDSQTIAQFMSKVKQEMIIIQPVEMLQKRVQTDMTVQNIDNLQLNNKKLTQKMKKLEELDQKQITTIIEEDEKPIKKHDTSLINDLNQIAASALDNEIVYQQSPKESRSTSIRESTQQLPQLQLFSNIQQQDQGFSAQQAFADRMQQIQVQKSVRGSSETKYSGITFDLQQVEKQDPNQKATDKIIQVSVPQSTHNVQTLDIDLYDKIIQVGSTILDYQDQSIQTEEVDDILNVKNSSNSHQIKLKDAESSSSSVLIQQNGTHNTFEFIEEPKKSDNTKNEQSDKLEELDIMQPKKSKKSSDHKSSSVSKQSLFSKDQSLPKKTTKPERRKSVVGVSKTSKPPATKIRQSVSNEKIIEKTETIKEEEQPIQNALETKTEQSEINVPLFSGQQVNFNYLDQNYVNEERQLETLKQSKKKAKLVNNTAQTDPEEIIEYNDIDVQTEGNEDNATPIHVTQSNNSDTQKSSRKAPSAKQQLLPSNPPRPPQIVLPQVIKAEQIQVKELPEQYQKLYQVQPTPRHLLDQKPDDNKPKNQILKYTSIYYAANTSQQIVVSQNVQSIQDQSIQTNQTQSSNTSSNTTTTTENQVTQTTYSQAQQIQNQQVSVQTNSAEAQQTQQQQQQVQPQQIQSQTMQKQDTQDQKKVEPNNDEKQMSEEMKIRLLENELKIQLQNQQEGINANNLIEKQNNMLQVQLLEMAKTKDQIEFEKMKIKQKYDEVSVNYQESTLLVEQLKQNVLELNDVIKNHEIELFTIRTENSRTKHYSNKETQCDEPIIVQKIDNLNINQKYDQMIGKQQDEKAETKTETEIKDQITLNQNSQSKELIKMELAANQSEEQFHQSKQLLEIPLIKENSNLKKNAKSRSTSVSSNKQKNNKLDKINQEIINKNNEKSEQNKVLKSEPNQTHTQIVESVKQNSKEVSQNSTDIKRRSKSQIESMEKLSIQGQVLINSEKRRSSSTNNIKTQKLSRKPSQSAKSEQNSQQNNSPIDLLKSAEVSEPKHADQREISVNEKIMESKNVMNKYKEKRVIESSNITMRLNSEQQIDDNRDAVSTMLQQRAIQQPKETKIDQMINTQSKLLEMGDSLFNIQQFKTTKQLTAKYINYQANQQASKFTFLNPIVGKQQRDTFLNIQKQSVVLKTTVLRQQNKQEILESELKQILQQANKLESKSEFDILLHPLLTKNHNNSPIMEKVYNMHLTLFSEYKSQFNLVQDFESSDFSIQSISQSMKAQYGLQLIEQNGQKSFICIPCLLKDVNLQKLLTAQQLDEEMKPTNLSLQTYLYIKLRQQLKGEEGRPINAVIPDISDQISLINFASISRCFINRRPIIVQLIEQLSQPLQFVEYNSIRYYKIKAQLRSLPWLLKTLRVIYQFAQQKSQSQYILTGQSKENILITESQQEMQDVNYSFSQITGKISYETLPYIVLHFATQKYSNTLASVFLQQLMANVVYWSFLNVEVKMFSQFLFYDQFSYDTRDLFQIWLLIRNYFNLDKQKAESLQTRQIVADQIDQLKVSRDQLVDLTRQLFQGFSQERFHTLLSVLLCLSKEVQMEKCVPLIFNSYLNYRAVLHRILLNFKALSIDEFKQVTNKLGIKLSQFQLFEHFCSLIQQKEKYSEKELVQLQLQQNHLIEWATAQQLARFVKINEQLIPQIDLTFKNQFIDGFQLLRKGIEHVISICLSRKNVQKEIYLVQNKMNVIKTDLSINNFLQMRKNVFLLIEDVIRMCDEAALEGILGKLCEVNGNLLIEWKEDVIE